MIYLLFLSFLLFVFVAILRIKKQKRKSFIQQIVIPEHVGYRKRIPLYDKVEHLDIALDSHFQERIKKRYMDEHNEKLAVEHEFDLLFLELKRFFIMCSLLKNVPMFSEKVDAIWHEMLMFTQEYEQFSNHYYGKFLHHEPVVEKVPEPDNRAFFDLIYTQLFEFTAYTPLAWGAFYRNPLNRNEVEEILSLSVDDIKQKYFREDADNGVVIALIEHLKEVIEDSLEQKEFKIEPHHYKKIQEHSPLLASGMIFYSVYHADSYEQYMTPNDASSLPSNSSSGCGTGGNSNCGGGGSSCGGGGCGSS